MGSDEKLQVKLQDNNQGIFPKTIDYATSEHCLDLQRSKSITVKYKPVDVAQLVERNQIDIDRDELKF